MTLKKRKRRGMTPWKKTALRFCVLFLLAAGAIHGFRLLKALEFEDQREAFRWGAEQTCAQVSAFMPMSEAMKEEDIQGLEYKIHTSLAQDSIKLSAEGEDAKLWQDCYSGIGSLTLAAGSKTVTVEAVGTGGAFFTFHPLKLSAGTYYLPDSVMKDEILLDQETAWKLFGAFDVEGRTVRVQDMYLRIAGVYEKPRGGLYEKAGLPDYVVFVQYKTLLQYGRSGNGSDSAGQSAAAGVPGSASRPAVLGRALASENEAPPENDTDAGSDAGAETDSGSDAGSDAGSDSGSDSGSETDSGTGTGSSSETGSGSAAGSGETPQSGTGDEQGTVPDETNNNENVGTANTNYKDTGMITTYEIVMPDPVEGYAAAVVKKALGEESAAIVVDNTNRFEIRNLVEDIRGFALLGMRTEYVRYPYWENVAKGWETIFAALFLLECILIVLTILLLVWMIIHWFRHKSWTLVGSIQRIQDSAYERQSRKRYPEYYRKKEQSGDDSEPDPSDKEPEEKRESDPADPAGEKDDSSTAPAAKDSENIGRLEDKGLTPFERIPENRKAVEYETKYQDDQRSDGSGAGTDNDGLRRRKQQ
ncbi:MAG: ABC transporter permease [Lachnospiraceae bacterium]|nr:ABC transporter permease [Lachnospiraceae bacterium]